jgi:hypothetical protein
MTKQNWLGSLALAATAALTMSSCMKDNCKRMVTYTKETPVYKSYADIRHNITAESPRAIQQAGKIYLYNEFVLINEVDKGVHIFEISPSATATPLSFIPILGNKEITVRNGVLFADNYTDLVAIDLTDVRNPSLVSRKEDAFPIFWNDTELGMMVGYDRKVVTEELNCQEAQWVQNNGGWGGRPNEFSLQSDMTTNAVGGGGSESGGGRGSGTGIGGSMARFTILGAHLYTVDNMDLHVFDISDASNINDVAQVNIGWGIETIFPANGHLFIGSNTGMFIYEVSNPANPTQLSRFDHAEACDPVFVSGNFAYVTLRTGTLCNNGSNELNVLDVSDLTNPVLLNTYPMHNPHGLSVLNDVLYLCEGNEGLKGFNVADKMAIDQNQLFHDNGFDAFDVIASPYQPILMVIGTGGMRIYNNSNANAPVLVTTIATTP